MSVYKEGFSIIDIFTSQSSKLSNGEYGVAVLANTSQLFHSLKQLVDLYGYGDTTTTKDGDITTVTTTVRLRDEWQTGDVFIYTVKYTFSPKYKRLYGFHGYANVILSETIPSNLNLDY